MEQKVSDEEILRLWHDPTFSGSFRGVRTFQTLLKTELNINISESRLHQILKTDTLFLIHQRPISRFPRRKYDVNFYGQLIQMDIAYMFPDEKTKFPYFLLVVDVFSFKIFVRLLKDKGAVEVLAKLKEIIQDFNQTIYEIQCDRGKEFLSRSMKLFLKENSIVLSLKYGKNKASVAEYAILRVKRKLYMLLRSELSHNWVEYISVVVTGLNATPLKKLGGLTPNSIHNEASTVFVEKAKKNANGHRLPQPTYKDKEKNQQNYSGDLKVGDFVYLDFKENVFDKSFDVSVCYLKFEKTQFE